MKGLRTSTLSLDDFKQRSELSVPLRTRDLRLWYRLNGPTYLAVYVECADKFFILNIVDFVDREFGVRIFELDQESVTVRISKQSELDDQAFALLLRKGTAEEWARVLTDPIDIHLALRDFRLIGRLSSASIRGVEHQVVITDWQSKLRGEIEFLERPIDTDGEWKPIRDHWQFMLSIERLESVYPYLEFAPFNEEEDEDLDDGSRIQHELTNGTLIYGYDAAGEYYEYQLRPSLNALGQRLAGIVETLGKASIVDLAANDDPDSLDVAPWHWRDV